MKFSKRVPKKLDDGLLLRFLTFAFLFAGRDKTFGAFFVIKAVAIDAGVRGVIAPALRFPPRKKV